MDLDFNCCEVKKALGLYYERKNPPNKVQSVQPCIIDEIASFKNDGRTVYYGVVSNHANKLPQLFTTVNELTAIFHGYEVTLQNTIEESILNIEICECNSGGTMELPYKYYRSIVHYDGTAFPYMYEEENTLLSIDGDESPVAISFDPVYDFVLGDNKPLYETFRLQADLAAFESFDTHILATISTKDGLTHTINPYFRGPQAIDFLLGEVDFSGEFQISIEVKVYPPHGG